MNTSSQMVSSKPHHVEQLAPNVLRSLPYLQDLPSAFHISKPLSSYRRNLLITGTINLFLIVSGMTITETQIGFIKGDIANLYFVQIFLVIVFLYQWLMYYVHLRRDDSIFLYREHPQSSFTQHVAKRVLFIEFEKALKNHNLNGTIDSYEFGSSSIDNDQASFEFKLIQEHKPIADTLASLNEFEINDLRVKFTYKLSSEDKLFFINIKSMLKYATITDKLEYSLPNWYAGFVSGTIIGQIIYQSILI